MELVWIGHSCFRLRGRSVTIITDPCSGSSGYTLGPQLADLVTVSNEHPHHNAVSEVGGEPAVLNGPGEYEVKGVIVTGVRTNQAGAQKDAVRNTAYIITIDDVTVCHLGDVANMPPAEQVELMKEAEVLLIPVGGGCTIGAAEAVEMISQVEPKLVVPMHYATSASKVDLDGIDRFLREMGLTHVEPQARLNITRGSLPDEPTVALLQPRQ